MPTRVDILLIFTASADVAGRATVELIIERKGDPAAYVTRSGGGPVPQARIGITLDGYSAPLTAGNFAANVQDGVYDGKTVNASYASVLAGRGVIPGLADALNLVRAWRKASCACCDGRALQLRR